MTNNQVTIRVEGEDELQKFAAEAAHILVNLRHYQDRWEGESGHRAEDKNARKAWEKRADEFLGKYKVSKTNKVSHIKIENQTT